MRQGDVFYVLSLTAAKRRRASGLASITGRSRPPGATACAASWARPESIQQEQRTALLRKRAAYEAELR